MAHWGELPLRGGNLIVQNANPDPHCKVMNIFINLVFGSSAHLTVYALILPHS